MGRLSHWWSRRAHLPDDAVPAGRAAPGALTTGLIFGVPGLASVAAGIIAGRLIGRRGARTVLTAGLLAQAACTAPLMLLGADKAWLAVLLPALFCGFFAVSQARPLAPDHPKGRPARGPAD